LSNVLVVVAHPDDEVFVCGGAMARHAARGDHVHTLFLADGETARLDRFTPGALADRRAARRQAAMQAAAALGTEEPRFLDLPDNRLDGEMLLDIIKQIEAVIREVVPETVFTHHHGDLNSDHRIAHRAALTACRIFAGEALSSTEWATEGTGGVFAPTTFVDIASTLDTKLKALAAYSSELRPFPHLRSLDTVRHLACLRGATVGLEAAEAFVLVREVR
jgi:LmbE family N-acetylglucosaminyl deacetylase